MARPFLAMAILLAAQAGTLRLLGQPLVCTCGQLALFVRDVWSSQTSQQLTDWYTFSHIIHGFIFYLLLWLLFPRVRLAWRLVMAVGIEAAWEIAENTPWVIEAYRRQALAQGYVGDSILNSLMDNLAMMLGFLLAARLPWQVTVGLALAMEAGVAWAIHDNLTLNILGFFHQFDVITEWQSRR